MSSLKDLIRHYNLGVIWEKIIQGCQVIPGATLKMNQTVEQTMFLSMNNSFTLYQILKIGKSQELTQMDTK